MAVQCERHERSKRLHYDGHHHHHDYIIIRVAQRRK